MSAPAIDTCTDEQPTAPRYYRPELDWVRFVAFCAVFLLHTFPATADRYTAIGIPVLATDLFLPLIRAGGFGVDLFFTLSSFLITELLLLERQHTGRVHVPSFYVRRLLRIWPLYFGIVFTIGTWSVHIGQISMVHFLALMTFTYNWSPLMAELPRYVTHLWSVCVEEQFYVVWPVLISRINNRRFVPAMILVWAVAIAFRAICPLLGAASPQYYTLARLDGFALGGVLAYVLHGRKIEWPLARRVAMWLGAMTIFWGLGRATHGAHMNTDLNLIFPFAAIASAAIILAFIAGSATMPLGALGRTFSYLGKISYGLYMYHWPAIVLTHRVFGTDDDAHPWLWVYRFFAAAVTTLLASMASYALLEKPFLVLKQRFTFVSSRPV